MRITAFLLLIAQSLWTVAPVCGSVTDVDARACCERHVACHEADGTDTQSADPSQCCDKGDRSYPTALLRSLAAPELGATPAVVVAEPEQPAAAAALCAVDPRLPLKIPIIPLYLLTSNYRI